MDSTESTRGYPSVRGRRRGPRALVGTIVVVLVLAAFAAVQLSRVLDAGPGEPGWQPIEGSSVGGTTWQHGELDITQLVTNREEQAVTVEQIRTLPPPGFVETEVGGLPVNSWQELDLFDLIKAAKPPFTIGPGRSVKLFVRYRVDCLPSSPPKQISLRIMLTVSMGSVRQEVEVPDVRPISLVQTDPPTQVCR